MESFKANNIESQESLKVKIDYTILGFYKNQLKSETIDSFELPEFPKDAYEFDGYFETNIGNFAFQGKIQEAKRVIETIKTYCEKEPKLKSRLEEIEDEMAEQTTIQREFGPRGKDNFEKFGEAVTKIDNLAIEEKRLKTELEILEGSVKPFLI